MVQQSHDSATTCSCRRICLLTLLALSLASRCAAFAVPNGAGYVSFIPPNPAGTKSSERGTSGWFGVVQPLAKAARDNALSSGSPYEETLRSSNVQRRNSPHGRRSRIPIRPFSARSASSRNVIAMEATDSRAPKIIIAGAPASGKGTQCSLIKERYGVVHLSTGERMSRLTGVGSHLSFSVAESTLLNIRHKRG